jgi:hypothetical protein
LPAIVVKGKNIPKYCSIMSPATIIKKLSTKPNPTNGSPVVIPTNFSGKIKSQRLKIYNLMKVY